MKIEDGVSGNKTKPRVKEILCEFHELSYYSI